MAKRLRIFPELPEEPGQASAEAGKVRQPGEADTIAFLHSEWTRSRQAIEALRSQIREQDQALQAVTARLREKDEAAQALTGELNERTQAAQALTDQLEASTRSKTWRVALHLRRLRPWLAPRGGLRERCARAGLR